MIHHFHFWRTNPLNQTSESSVNSSAVRSCSRHLLYVELHQGTKKSLTLSY